jgi:chemotaxis protein methyltransferase WspC
MRALKLASCDDYAARVDADPGEFQLLLADVVVPETWFFRGDGIFAHLAEHVSAAVRDQGSGKRFRILSIACSTGEEPYSLAIALAVANITPTSWELEAVDINSRSLEIARRGRYGKFSFRQNVSKSLDHYFRQADEAWELDSAIRSRVRFRQGNVVDPLFLTGETSFDLILCRNLFIYLHVDARRLALNTITRLLTSDGLLCAGSADPVDVNDGRLVRTGPPSFFLFQKREHTKTGWPDRHAAMPWTFNPKLSALQKTQESAVTTRHEKPAAESAKAHAQPALPVDLLERASQHADAGRLDEALACCQELLGRDGPSADLCSLMGIIHQARQEMEDAVRWFQKALYLEQEHREALAHLMLLVKEQGDHSQADRLRRRLDRVTQGGDR